METNLTPYGIAWQRAGEHAAKAHGLLAERGGQCHCDDENCPFREPNLVAATMARAHADVGALYVQLASAMAAGLPDARPAQGGT